ncbi:3699_t:CDS:2, partial [Funneliformis geosporum]
GISWFTYKVYIWPYYTSPLRNIPGPPSDSFLYGNFKRFFVEEAGEPYLRWAKEYGSFVKYNTILNKPILSITDEKILKDILLSKVYEFRRPEERNANSKRILGHGLFLAEGETHKRQRKMMNPAFIHHNIKDMVPTFIRVGMTLKGLIENKVNKGESRINLTPYLLKTTMDIIGAAGFNHEFNSLTSPSELAEAYDIIMNDKPTTLSNSISILSYYIPFIRKIPINVNNKFNYGCDVIEREAKKIVDERYQDDKLQGKDLLSLLISINKTLPIEEKITDDELKYQVVRII